MISTNKCVQKAKVSSYQYAQRDKKTSMPRDKMSMPRETRRWVPTETRWVCTERQEDEYVQRDKNKCQFKHTNQTKWQRTHCVVSAVAASTSTWWWRPPAAGAWCPARCPGSPAGPNPLPRAGWSEAFLSACHQELASASTGGQESGLPLLKNPTPPQLVS